jgi:hypothetical protein
MLRTLILTLAACAPEEATLEAPIPEHCNGLDDDGDGATDEGFDDADRNGRPDCLDTTCWDLAEAEAGAIDAETCRIPTVGDPWAVETLWTYGGGEPGRTVSYGSLAVAHLDDDDGDGAYGSAGDHPEVVLVASDEDTTISTLIALDGRTGAERWAVPGPDPWSGLAIADVDGDDAPDIVAIDEDAHLVVYAADGSIRDGTPSLTLDRELPFFEGDPLVADLDADSDVEILAGGWVFAGSNLQPLRELVTAEVWSAMPAIGDVDGDGDKEIALGGRLFDADGTWTSDLDVGLISTALFVQADADPDAEIVWGGQTTRVVEPGGTELASWGGLDYPQPGCAADFDGDGVTEVGSVSRERISVFELDGTPLWSERRSTGMGGCSAFDFDGDGAAELLYSTLGGLHVFDGPTGDERLLAKDVVIGQSDAPIVADLDGDGSPEILGAATYYADEGGPLVQVLTHPDGAWPAAPRVRPSFDYDGGNIRDDGSVPPRPPSPWLSAAGPRSIPVVAAPQYADLSARILDACTGDPGFGPVVVTAEVRNHGKLAALPGAQLTLLADDGDGVTREVATASLDLIPSATVAETVRFELGPQDVGAVGWQLVVDADGRVLECDESDNTDAMEHP